jgi:hypothetical protein
MFLHSKPESSVFFFYHRRIGLEPSDLELRLIITGDNDVVDLI